MESTNSTKQPAADFHAVLTPYRSLSRGGFKILMLVLLLCLLPTALVFLSMGAWPVFGFLGLDILAVYLAFRINYRAGRQYEEVQLSRDALLVRKVAASGKTLDHQFNPLWTKLFVARHPVIGVTKMSLTSGTQRVAVGDFLNPDDRDSFSKALSSALASVKAR